ncbi:hypothetical protein ACQ4PT_002871 [Festuca glaucescens]
MAMSTTTLPEKVEREILLRLDDVPTLFRCAAACKRWRRLVAAPSFLQQRRWPRSLLVGYFTRRCRVAMFPGTSPTAGCNSQLAFVPLPGPSLLGCTSRRPLSSFVVPADDAAAAAVVDRSVPLATRGGLLLVRLYPSDDDLEPDVVRLAVCNPLAGTWEVLPELDCDSRFGPSDGYGRDILPSIAGDNDGPAYRVLLIGADKHKSQYNLHAFAGGDASWSAPVMCFDMMDRQIWSMEKSKAVVCGGQAHWLFVSRSHHFHILNVDINTGHVSLTRLLLPTKEEFLSKDSVGSAKRGGATLKEIIRRALSDLACFDLLATTSDGTRLSLLVYRGGRLEVWTEQQIVGDGHRKLGGDSKWLYTWEIDRKLTELLQQLDRPSCFWSGARGDTALVHCEERIYIAYLDTATLQDVTQHFHDLPRGMILPMEIDWPTFFMLRLGSLSVE